jgi:5'-3' exonuclease
VAADGTEEVPDKLSPQIPLLLAVLRALGLAATGADGFEADDVMATLSARDHDRVEIVSGDRDMLALATERVRILYAGKGISKLADMGPAEVAEKYGIPAEHYADFAILRGDPSDGLPGVPGVGEKTAAAIVSRFGSVESIVAAAQQGSTGFPAGAANKVLGALDYLAVAPAAVRGRFDVPIGELNDALPPEPADAERLAELAAALGIDNSIRRIQTAIAAAIADPAD